MGTVFPPSTASQEGNSPECPSGRVLNTAFKAWEYVGDYIWNNVRYSCTDELSDVLRTRGETAFLQARFEMYKRDLRRLYRDAIAHGEQQQITDAIQYIGEARSDSRGTAAVLRAWGMIAKEESV